MAKTQKDNKTMVTFNNVSFSEDNIYLWDFNDDGIVDSNEPNPTYVFQNSGNYYVTLQVENNCNNILDSVSYEIVIDDFGSVGLDSQETLNKLIIHPNPAKDYLYIDILVYF